MKYLIYLLVFLTINSYSQKILKTTRLFEGFDLKDSIEWLDNKPFKSKIFVTDTTISFNRKLGNHHKIYTYQKYLSDSKDSKYWLAKDEHNIYCYIIFIDNPYLTHLYILYDDIIYGFNIKKE